MSKVFSGKVLYFGRSIDVPCVDVVLWTDPGGVALKVPEDGHSRDNRPGAVTLGIEHNTVGTHRVRSEVYESSWDLARANARYWRNSPRNSGTHVVIGAGRILQTCDLGSVAAYGAGKWANSRAVQIELAATACDGGTRVSAADVRAGALFFNALADAGILAKQTIAPRAYGRALVKALCVPRCAWSGLANHCNVDPRRDYGDNGSLIGSELVDSFGWKFDDPDSRALEYALPSWLSEAGNISGMGDAGNGGISDVLDIVDCVRGAGYSYDFALSVGAHAYTETGCGSADRGWNFWGWKCNKPWADSCRAKGREPLWYARPGHTAQGDPGVVFYRAFSAMDESVKAFLAHFAPGEADSGSRYLACGERARAGDGVGWFRALLAGGYRGTGAEEHPEGSVRDHAGSRADVLECWLQRRIGVTVDGAWGTRSRESLARAAGGQTEPSVAVAELLCTVPGSAR